MKHVIGLAFIAVLGTAAQAVTFSNIVISSAPYSNGASWTTSGNSISFFTPNAVIDEGVPTPATVLSIQYDIDAGAGLLVSGIGANVSAVQLGSGSVSFLERAFVLDSMGNEISGVVGSISNPSFASSFTFTGSTSLSQQSRWIRIKKDFVMAAPNTSPARDLAAVVVNNQNIQVVPEPATMTALGLGALAILRRRRSK